jgi:ppGpp synthetase/RelA/SpoT-type nucleotidyltranferase
MSVQKLSNPNEETIFDSRCIKRTKIDSLKPLNEAIQGEQEQNWREIVKKRVESKTRLISKGSQKTLKMKQNNYSDVFGYFFFNLIQPYDL